MSEYKLRFTRESLPEIALDEKDINYDYDVTLFGRLKLEYGRELNENFVHILENFASFGQLDEFGNYQPDTTQTSYHDADPTESRNFLTNPVEGQLWFNKSDDSLYQWHMTNGGEWVQLSSFGSEIGANWGQILHGNQLPLPVSPSGYEFSVDECSWMVSPFSYPTKINYMVCNTDSVANVTMQYKTSIGGPSIDGIASYLIVGIKDNNNEGGTIPPSGEILTPTATP